MTFGPDLYFSKSKTSRTVPVKQTVTRGGRSFVMTVWKRPNQVEPLLSFPAPQTPRVNEKDVVYTSKPTNNEAQRTLLELSVWTKKTYNSVSEVSEKGDLFKRQIAAAVFLKGIVEEVMAEPNEYQASFKNLFIKDPITKRILGGVNYKEFNDNIYVACLAAHPDYISGVPRKIGAVGSRLLLPVLKQALKSNKPIDLSASPKAIPFYRAIGFDYASTEDAIDGDRGVTAYMHLKEHDLRLSVKRLKEFIKNAIIVKAQVKADWDEVLNALSRLEARHKDITVGRQVKDFQKSLGDVTVWKQVHKKGKNFMQRFHVRVPGGEQVPLFIGGTEHSLPKQTPPPEVHIPTWRVPGGRVQAQAAAGGKVRNEFKGLSAIVPNRGRNVGNTHRPSKLQSQMGHIVSAKDKQVKRDTRRKEGKDPWKSTTPSIQTPSPQTPSSSSGEGRTTSSRDTFDIMMKVNSFIGPVHVQKKDLIFSKGNIDNLIKMNVDSVNQVYTAKIKKDGKGIFKPVNKERSDLRESINLDEFSQAEREVLAYQVSKILGLDFIPPTVLKESEEEGIGSCQQFVPKLSHSYGPPEDFFDHKTLEVASALDDILGNTDRHGANWGRVGKKLVFIDNGLTFEDNEYVHYRTFADYNNFRSSILGRDYLGILKKAKRKSVTLKKLFLEVGLPENEGRSFFARLDNLISRAEES